MLRISRMIFAILILVLFSFCGSLKHKKSLNDLRTAYNNESTAAEKYAKFALAAQNQGFDTLSQLFSAVSKSERVHAVNFGRIIDKYGLDTGGPEIGNFEIKSTPDNLKAGIKTETYDMQTTYPLFIRTAEGEKSAEIARLLSWAENCEKKHLQLFRKALLIIGNGTETGIPFVWYICSGCGNIYSQSDLPLKCELCLTKQENFFGYTKRQE